VTPPHGAAAAPAVPSGAVGAATPRLADGVEILGELSGSGYHDAPTLVRRADGQTLQVTPLLATLIALIDGERSFDQLASVLSERLDKTAAAEDVRYLVEQKLTPLGLIHDPAGSSVVAEKSNPLLALRFKVVASTPEVTRRLTSPFTWLFRSAVVIPVLMAFAFVCWWVLADKGLASATRSAFYDPPLLLAVLGITVLSAGLHEFGHAAACRYGGATPGAMGAGLYIVWPAFYTDVDDSYRLSRWGRLRVDLGGLYFNALIAVGIATWWWFTKQDALLLGVASQLLQMLRQLAPYIRADGYHILADLTGVPDLFAHMKPTLLSMLPWRWGRPSGTPLKTWARVVVALWVLLVVPMLLAMFLAAVLLLPRLISTAGDSAGNQWAALSASLDSGDVLGVLARTFSLVALFLPIAAISYMLLRLARRAPTKVWRDTEGKPAARLAAAMVGVLLLTGVGWAWWPDGQYQPVQASERGTLQGLLTRPSAIRHVPPTRARVTPQTALALVPRAKDGTHPAVLLVNNDDGSLRTIYTAGTDGDPAEAGRAFPFTLPDAPAEGDNQALATNDKDGAVEYDVAVALVYVTDGEAALNTNAAYALASCTACTTVAVAFQVLLVVGETDIVAPTNAAVAANSSCLACATAALAVQLVVTLREMPDEQVRAQIEAAMAKLDGLDEVTASLDVGDVYTQVKAVEAEVLSILVTHGLVDDVTQTEVTASPTAAPTASTAVSGSPSASSEPTESSTSASSPSSAPGGTASAEASSPPSPSESPSSSSTPSATP